jgi:hypothetical protein
MKRLHVGIIVVLLAVGVAGVAFAVGLEDDDPAPKLPRATTTLAEGQASDGKYTISAVDTEPDSTMFCFEIATERQRGHGCVPVPPAGDLDAEALMPRRTLLGTDRFASLLAPKGVEGMRVVDPGGEVIAEARAVSIERFGQLLVATWGGEIVTSRRPDPDRTLELIDEHGEVVGAVPFPGFGKAS